jgi:hypothetical protein
MNEWRKKVLAEQKENGAQEKRVKIEKHKKE